MMTFNRRQTLNVPQEAYVWIWLPDQLEPVVAGKLTTQGDTIRFRYGQQYLARPDAISLYDQELPLKSGILPLVPGLIMPSCVRDASPDAWGRRIILNRLSQNAPANELVYLLESSSDRIGALDFQRSATVYEARDTEDVSLEEIMEAAERMEKGLPLSPELDRALNHGTSIGGARPKALVEDQGKKYIAKFSSSSDLFNIIKAEYVAMELARLAGLSVASVSLAPCAKKEVLLIERFDRVLDTQFSLEKKWFRRTILSGLTLFALDEMMARYASYQDLAEIIRLRFEAPHQTLRELFSRLVFNILVGNTDDHARNHAAFWDGKNLSLTPAYDICPQNRSGNESTQAMLIFGQERWSKLSTCLKAAPQFLLAQAAAQTIIDDLMDSIRQHWQEVCDKAGLTTQEKDRLWGRQFLNPFVFEA